jgi:hypothetical protein
VLVGTLASVVVIADAEKGRKLWAVADASIPYGTTLNGRLSSHRGFSLLEDEAVILSGIRDDDDDVGFDSSRTGRSKKKKGKGHSDDDDFTRPSKQVSSKKGGKRDKHAGHSDDDDLTRPTKQSSSKKPGKREIQSEESLEIQSEEPTELQSRD